MKSKPFKAFYGGRCEANCGTLIEAGDMIVLVDGKPTHEECADDTESTSSTSGRNERPCSCGLTHAGECF